jgi:hypothetical protein
MMEGNKLIMMMVITLDFTLISRLTMINSDLLHIDLFYHKAFEITLTLECGSNYSGEAFICRVQFYPKLKRMYDMCKCHFFLRQ